MTIVNTETGEVIEPLTDTESAEFAECEAQVERGLSTFVEVGTALERIREGRFYRTTHDTFGLYCTERWGMHYRHANRLIEAAATVEALGPMGPTPTTERQARELSGLAPEEAAEVLTEANETTGGNMTAAAIAAARERLHPKPPAPRPIGEVGRGAGQTREGEEPEAPVPPASEPAPSIAVPPRPPVDALADAVAEFPEVAYFAEKGDPDKAIETARNLRGYSEREQPMRRENLRKWIAADQRGAFDKKPTREVTGTDVMQALATAFGYLARAGGTDRVADDLLAEDPDALDFNRTALDQYAAQLGDLIDALVPTLRRIK